MKPYRHYPIFILGYLFSISDAAVTIATTDNLNSAEYLECNSAVTLTCTCPTGTISMSWSVDGTLQSECVFGICSSYSPFLGSYSFTDDLSSATFTLKMDPLKFTDNGRAIICSDGSDSDTFSPDVKVLADSASTTITSTTGSFDTDITVATGCVYPPGSITFTWQYFKSGETPQPYDTTSPSAKTTDATGCLTGDCGGAGVESVSQTLIIEEDSSGEAYFFQVVVNHADATGHDITVTTTGTYKLAATTTTTTTTTTISSVPCGCTVCAIILLILAFIVAIDDIVIASLLYNDGLSTFAIVGIVIGILAAVGIIVAIIVCVVTLEPTCSLSICAILGIVIGSIGVLALIAVIVYVIITKQGVCNGKVLPFGICGDADGKVNDIENNSKDKKQDKTPTGAAHGREESQSVVSKQDVVIEKRPIPDIPKNNKFRGLSANLEDNNYMTGIDLPAEPKPKNALEPIEPVPKKKKKRKKAKKDAPDSQRTEDEQE